VDSEKVLSVSEILGINPESGISSLIEGSIDTLPYMGKVYNAFKMNRFQARLKRVEGRLLKLSSTMIENEDELLNEFIQKKAFPFTLNELLEEHEEEKVDLILNGLEYTYKQGIREESKVLVYFDVLRDLRVEEIKKLIEYSKEYEKPDISSEIKIDFPPYGNQSKMDKYYENRGYASYVDNHLEKLGLLNIGMESVLQKVEEMYRQLNGLESTSYTSSFRREQTETKLTQYGEYFIKFFDLTSLIQIPAD